MASVTAAPCTISSSGIRNFSLPRAARANASSVTFVTSSRSASQTTAGPAIGLKMHLPKSRVRRSSVHQLAQSDQVVLSQPGLDHVARLAERGRLRLDHDRHGAPDQRRIEFARLRLV